MGIIPEMTKRVNSNLKRIEELEFQVKMLENKVEELEEMISKLLLKNN